MNRILVITLFTPGLSLAQTYTHPTTGIANEYVGACLVSTCSGTYMDNGGTGNYSNSINSIYRVFCPNTAGNCVSVTFNSFAMEGQVDPPGPNPLNCYYDYLTIGNGPTQNSTLFTTAPATSTGRICGTPATPFSYTSTHASGCLTFRFTSDGSVNMAGWSATLSCVPCSGGPTGTTNSDCAYATPICANSGNSGNASGPGIVAEGCSGASCPAGGENHTNWYSFTILAGGTLSFNIVPSVSTDDYDFTLYGPGTTCGALGSPIRCSDAGTTGTTGMASGNSDNTEDVLGNGFVAPLNVTAGQTYYLVVDEWTPTGSGYSLNFTGTATFDCAVLPVELISFGATYAHADRIVDLSWSTATETNSDYFTIEKTTDGANFREIVRVKAAGNSITPLQYVSFDSEPTPGISYYRLSQVDRNGQTSFSKIVAVNINADVADPLLVHPNPSASKINITYTAPGPQRSSILIYDYTGRIVYAQEVKSDHGSNTHVVDVSLFSKGIYLVAVQNGQSLAKTRFSKQ